MFLKNVICKLPFVMAVCLNIWDPTVPLEDEELALTQRHIAAALAYRARICQEHPILKALSDAHGELVIFQRANLMLLKVMGAHGAGRC